MYIYMYVYIIHIIHTHAHAHTHIHTHTHTHTPHTQVFSTLIDVCTKTVYVATLLTGNFCLMDVMQTLRLSQVLTCVTGTKVLAYWYKSTNTDTSGAAAQSREQTQVLMRRPS
jgi:hypothetical protein